MFSELDPEKLVVLLFDFSISTLLKLAYFVGFIAILIKFIFIKNLQKLISFIWFLSYSITYKDHLFFLKLEQMQNHVELGSYNVKAKRKSLASDILRLEYILLHTFVDTTIAELVSMPRTWYKPWEWFVLDPIKMSEFIESKFQTSKEEFYYLLKQHEIPKIVIDKYRYERNLIYEEIDMHILLFRNYYFCPLVIKVLLDVCFSKSITMQKRVVDFVNSMNGELDGIEYEDLDGHKVVL